MTGQATAAGLAAACKAGGLRAVRLLLDQGAPVTDEVWRAAAARADPALVFLLETADLTRDTPAWLAAALALEETAAELPRIVEALEAADFGARRKAAQRLLGAVDAGEALAAAVRRRALAVSLSHTPEETAVMEEALAGGLNEKKARGAGLTEGRAVRLAASTMTTADLRRDGVDWARIDRLRGHGSAAAREGAVSALAAAWAGHAEPAAITSRLLDALSDENEGVGRAAGVRIADGLREGLATIETVRARLPEGAARSGGAVGDLARVTEEIAEARQRHRCEACGALGAAVEWGESVGGPNSPEPPEMRHLRRCVTRAGDTDLYRCSQCGAYFELARYEETFLSGNSTWYSYALTRWQGPTEELDVYEAARANDSPRLRALLLDEPDDAARVRKLDALARLVREQYDAARLRPDLTALAGPDRPPEVRKAAASVLALNALRAQGPRVSEVAALIESGDEALRAAAVGALVQANDNGVPAAKECARRVRPTLWALAARKGEHRYPALRLLCSAALDAETVAQAAANLQADSPGLRDRAADVIAAAANAHLDVSAALPRLAELLSDPDMRDAALKALGDAHLGGADVAPFVPQLAAFVRARPTANLGINVAHILHALQERSVDITAAFEALALDGRDWPMSVLQHAVQRGRDVQAAVPELARRAAEDASYLGRIAAEILAVQFARMQDWERLTPLLEDSDPERASAAVTAVERAVVMEQAPLEALYLLGRRQAGGAAADPKRTLWTKGSDNVEVREQEVVRWTEDGRGGIGTSCTLEEFLAGRDRRDHVSVYQTFGGAVLNEVVAAARRMAQEKGKR